MTDTQPSSTREQAVERIYLELGCWVAGDFSKEACEQLIRAGWDAALASALPPAVSEEIAAMERLERAARWALENDFAIANDARFYEFREALRALDHARTPKEQKT